MITNNSLIINTGRKIKKIIRQLRRAQQFGVTSFSKTVSLPQTSFQILINPSKNGTVDHVIATTGLWEEPITTALAKHLPVGGTFIDIGANIGYHTLFAAGMVGNTGTVYAFEPISSLYDQLTASVQLNNFTNVQAQQIGLGETASMVTIHLRDENMGGSSLFAHEQLDIVRVSSSETIQVKPLDEVIPATTHVDLIKIDVEGYEFEALKGATKLLTEQNPVLCLEFSPVFYEQDYAGKSIELLNFLIKLGYGFQTTNGTSIDLFDWLENKNRPGQIDVIAISNYTTRV